MLQLQQLARARDARMWDTLCCIVQSLWRATAEASWCLLRICAVGCRWLLALHWSPITRVRGAFHTDTAPFQRESAILARPQLQWHVRALVAAGQAASTHAAGAHKQHALPCIISEAGCNLTMSLQVPPSLRTLAAVPVCLTAPRPLALSTDIMTLAGQAMLHCSVTATCVCDHMC